MINKTENPVLLSLKELRKHAIKLKELLDRNVTQEELQKQGTIYLSKWTEIINMIPYEIRSLNRLERHNHFIRIYLNRNEKIDKYDIENICAVEISDMENFYRNYLETKAISEREWSKIFIAIREVAQPLFEKHKYYAAIKKSFEEIIKEIRTVMRIPNDQIYEYQDLVQFAFSSSEKNNYQPQIRLAFQYDVNSLQIQRGYMNILSGAIETFLVPQDRHDLDANIDRAFEVISVASHFMHLLNLSRMGKFNV